MKFNIITIFPNMFESYFNESIIKRAQDKGIIQIEAHNLRDWTDDKHNTVDDTPYGGGAGMVMKIEPIFKALQSVTKESFVNKIKNIVFSSKKKRKIVLLSAKGKTWNQQIAKEYSELDEVIFVCGRYEGVDERVKEFIDEEISIGDYVMTGGELGTMVMIDSITRLLPGVLGNEQSIESESHNNLGELEHPQYTKPEIFKVNGKEYKVPEVLLSGNHRKIEEWKEGNKSKK